jgi:hypothetical protein
MHKPTKEKAPENHAREKKENCCKRTSLEELPEPGNKKTRGRREDIAG